MDEFTEFEFSPGVWRLFCENAVKRKMTPSEYVNYLLKTDLKRRAAEKGMSVQKYIEWLLLGGRR
jgi:hypothetical protein